MSPGLVPVVAVPGRERPDLDQEVLLAGGEPPGPVAAVWPGLFSGSEGERRPAGRVMPVGFPPSGRRGAAVPDRVPVLVGDGDAPLRPRVTGRGFGQVAGQVRVDRPDAAQLPGPVREA